jgi:hypothetical protein
MDYMARTDRDAPQKVREQYGERVPMLRGPGFRVNYVRPRWKSVRQKARTALARGAEPEPSRHRHSALWDRW